MSFFNRRAIVPAAALLIAIARAQTCYYPDGKSIAMDIPCNPDAPQTSCCASDQFCLSDGLCYGGGMVTRGSCTDQNWGPACAQVCTDGMAHVRSVDSGMEADTLEQTSQIPQLRSHPVHAAKTSTPSHAASMPPPAALTTPSHYQPTHRSFCDPAKSQHWSANRSLRVQQLHQQSQQYPKAISQEELWLGWQ